MAPVISIVMAVRNGERYLRQALDSVLAQSCAQFELIIVDDASDDGTPGIVASYAAMDPRLVVLTNTVRRGLTRSLNAGLGKAQGDFIARIDHDDVWKPHKLEIQLAFLTTHSDVGLVGTAYQDIDADGNLISGVRSGLLQDAMLLRRLFVKGNLFFHSSVLFRRQFANVPWMYDERFVCAQDYELWSRILAVSQAVILDSVQCYRRIDGFNISVRSEGAQRLNAMKVKSAWIKGQHMPFWNHAYLVKDLVIHVAPTPMVKALRALLRRAP
jgi:glycosyltransferase involved in cell wall biosynthesis